MQYHYLFKFLIVGDGRVGKSSIFSQFLEQKFIEEYNMTVGVEFGAKTLELENKKIKLQIWDTAGQEIFKSITRQYYRSTAGAILVYDITNRQSFQNIEQWLKECQEQGPQNMALVLVGNKVDLEKQRKVSKQEGQQLAKENNLLFIETSAKNNLNIIETFSQAALQVLKFVEKNQQKNEIIGVRIGQAFNSTQLQQNNSKSGGCC